jgi:hypothetical protein
LRILFVLCKLNLRWLNDLLVFSCMIRFVAPTVFMVEFNRSRLIMITRFLVVFFVRSIYFTRLFIFKTLSILVLLRIYCIWILLIGFSFLPTQNMGISNLIIFFIPRNLLMERRPIIHTITGRFFVITVTLIRWKELLIAIGKNLKSLMNFNLCCFCRFRLSIFNILFNHLLPSVFWIFLKLCGILDILIIFINLHFRRSLLILLVRWNVWFHKIWNNIQIFRFCGTKHFTWLKELKDFFGNVSWWIWWECPKCHTISEKFRKRRAINGWIKCWKYLIGTCRSSISWNSSRILSSYRLQLAIPFTG